MGKRRALPVVLEVLDDGLRLYRRHLASFMLIATAVLVVLALFSLSFMAFVRSEIGTSPGWLFLAVCLLLLLSYPLVLYVFGALSRAAAAALDGHTITLLSVLRLNPLRGIGIVGFNMLFSLITAISAFVLILVCSCPMTYLSLILSVFFGALLDSAGLGVGMFGLIGVISQISTLWTITVAGAWLATSVFALQAFVLEQRPWTEAASRTFDMLMTRFGQSLLMFLGAGAIFGTLALSYLGSLLVLWAFIQDQISLPPLAGDVIAIVLTVVTLVVLLPPLSIWMAIYYRRQVRERDGEEIIRRVADWRAQALSSI